MPLIPLSLLNEINDDYRNQAYFYEVFVLIILVAFMFHIIANTERVSEKNS